jgi:hypothetical protein
MIGQDDHESPLINSAEASKLTKSVTDRTTWQLLAMANTDIMMSIASDRRLPAAQFDMLFFAQVMLEVCGRHEQLRAILSSTE